MIVTVTSIDTSCRNDSSLHDVGLSVLYKKSEHWSHPIPSLDLGMHTTTLTPAPKSLDVVVSTHSFDHCL